MSEENRNIPPEVPSVTPAEDKLEATEVTVTSPLLKKLDNFWYHYKWTVIVVTFFATVLIVCLVQCGSRPEYDTSIVVATSYRMNSEEHGAFEDLMTRLIPADFNGDGKRLINIMTFEYYSEAEIAEKEEEYARPDAEGETDRFQINGAYNKAEFDNFNQYTLTGESSVYIVSPALYERLRESDRLLPLADIYGGDPLPAGARADGCGIDLDATDLYTYNPGIQPIPEDSILCLLRPTVSGKSSSKADYENEKKFFRALADLSVED